MGHSLLWLVIGRAKGHISAIDYSKKTRPLSLVFGNPGDDPGGKAGGHWQSGNFKVWINNQRDLAYARSDLGRTVRHETGHVVSDAIEQSVRTLESEIGRGKAGPDFTFFDAAGKRIAPPVEDETLRYFWMRQQVLSTYRKEATLPTHISEMMLRAMEQNARPKRPGSSTSSTTTAESTQ